MDTKMPTDAFPSQTGTTMPEPGYCACKFSSGGVLSKSCEFHEEQRKDGERLLYVKDLVDAIWDVDLHETAACNAIDAGRDEPNDADYLKAIRHAIDKARTQGDG